tara:strand:+ start:18968 stop:19972 length:1005 start_codon:yes stop_codon:yes gene_type:complete
MIFKSYILEKNISLLDSVSATLIYGENLGLKDDLKSLIKSHNKSFEEISLHLDDLIKNPDLIDEQVINTSLFNSKKIIIINDFSEKLKKKIINITQKLSEDTKIFIFTENMDKKSETRSHFEKEKKLGIVPCYKDNERTLSFYLREKLKDYQGVTQDLINLLIKNSDSDRKTLSHEIEKIKGLFTDKKIIKEKLLDLINNPLNIDFDNLKDSCLEANKKELNKNLGNAFIQTEKIYFYMGSLNNRIQKLMILNKLLEKNKDVEMAINTMKPKIFWKDVPIYKKQLKIWNFSKLKKANNIIFKTEMLIKTKLSSLSDVLIKKMLIELCELASTTS